MQTDAIHPSTVLREVDDLPARAAGRSWATCRRWNARICTAVSRNGRAPTARSSAWTSAAGAHSSFPTMRRSRSSCAIGPTAFGAPRQLEIVGQEMGLLPGLFSVHGDTWRRQRRMVMSAFDPTHVKAYFPSLLRVTQRLQGRWSKAAATRESVDLQADLMRFTVDAIAGLAFGAEINTLESDEEVIQHHLDKIFPALFKRIFFPIPYWRYVKLPSDRSLDRSMVEVNSAIAGFITRARESCMATRPDAPTRPTCWRRCWSPRTNPTAASATTTSPATC